MLSRQKSPDFIAFKQWTNEVAANRNLVRLDCLNPVKAIPHNFDFTDMPNITLHQAWQQYLNVQFKYYFFSRGVRDSLAQLFSFFPEVALPKGVYPVYQQLAHEAGIRIDPKSRIRLIASPFLGKETLEPPQDLLIIDRVYDYDNTDIQELIDTDKVIVCYSLSKTFLSPLLAGLTIVPSWLKDKFPSHHEPKAKVLLTKYKDFPKQQQQLFQRRWQSLNLPVTNGYLTELQEPAEQLLNKNILAVPGKVYERDNSIASCLHESLDKRYHVTVLANFAKGYDKYTRTYSKTNIPESTFPDKFFLLPLNNLTPGLNKAQRLATKTNDEIIIIQTNLTGKPHAVGEVINQNYITVEKVLNKDLQDLQLEDVYAQSLAKNPLKPWNELKPRSMSVLPVATACQARCSFCFSHSSISDDQKQATLKNLQEVCQKCQTLGATRMVITGGGEPTLLAHDKLLNIINISRTYFNKVVLITNGYQLGHAKDPQTILKDYVENGLTTLAISRHSKTNEVMKVDTKSENIKIIPGLKLRWICVLQQNGIHDEPLLHSYLDWVVTTPATEVCFKELYVAIAQESIYHNSDYNNWCKTNQVPLTLVVNFLNQYGKLVNTLPWGSPIYDLNWKGKLLRVAAYTEPSVFWERTHGICRSWNLLADGKCYANLETKESEIDLA